MENAQSQLNISLQQLDRIEKMIQAGSMPEADRYDFDSQVARDEQNLVLAENNVQTTLLNLKQLLQLPPDLNMELERPEINIPDVDPDLYTFDQVYTAALKTQFNIKADQLSKEIADLDIELARSQFYPSVTLGGSLSTTFATIAKQVDGFTDALIPQEGVFINGQPVLFQVESLVPTGTSNIPYIDQLDQNLGVGFGLQLSIPIYNRGRTKTNVSLAELNAENRKLLNEQTKQTLKSNVQAAIAEAQAAKRAYNAALLTMEAQEIAFQNSERRFDIGAGNAYEMTEAKNRLEVTQNDLLISKYDLIFKLKVIDYYLGNPIKLN